MLFKKKKNNTKEKVTEKKVEEEKVVEKKVIVKMTEDETTIFNFINWFAPNEDMKKDLLKSLSNILENTVVIEESSFSELQNTPLRDISVKIPLHNRSVSDPMVESLRYFQECYKHTFPMNEVGL